MRILKLRLSNLNSLTGSWELDFTDPAFADGIFAITGPTGAGKTTILDALCLALYGSTPRLGKITQSSNEIMSRQRDSCFAEVDFVAEQGGFRCSWHQHRSRTGRLRAAKRELARLDGQILAEKIKDVEAQIEELTGMDAERFTRSMLLAQGRFDAFLQAPPDKRAPILEQITGTELYSRISIRVHERCKAEKEAQQRLQEQADALRLLTAEEESELQQKLADLNQEEAKLKSEAEQLAAALAWLKKIAALRQELAKISIEQAGLAAERQNFAPVAERLARAEQALALEGDYAALAALREQQNKDVQAAADLRGTLPELEAALKVAGELLHQNAALLTKSKTEQEQGSLLLRQVRELDFRIQEKQTALQKQEAACAELRQNNAADVQKCQLLEQQSRVLQTQQEQSAAYLAEHQADKGLLTELTGICRQVEQVASLRKRLEKMSKDSLAADRQLMASKQLWQDKAARCAAAEQLLAETKEARAAAEEKLAQLLQGRRTADLRDEQNALSQLTKLLEQQEKLTDGLTKLRQQQEQNAADKMELSAQLDTLRQQRDSARLEEEKQRAVAAFASRVRSLEEERARLQDDKPCPLCGALEHPYAQGNLPLLDEAEQAAKAAGAALRQAEDSLNKAGKEQARLEQQAAHLADRWKEKSNAAQEVKEQADCLCKQLSLAPEQVALTAIDERLQENQQLVQTAEEAVEQISQLGKTLEQQQAGHSLVAQERDKAAAAQDKAEAEQQRIVDQQRELTQELTEQQEQVLRDTAVYGITAEFDKLAAALTVRKKAWQDHQDKCQAAEQQLAALQTDLKVLRAGIDSRTGQLETAERLNKELAQDLERMAADRVALFADKVPDAEEKRLAAAVKAAELAMQQVQEQRQQAADQLAQQHTLIKSRETAAAERTEPLQLQEAVFAKRLHESSFAAETDWLAARLPEQERKALRQQADALCRREEELQTRQKDRQDRLAAEEQAQLAAGQEPEQLRQAQDELHKQHRETVELIGSMRDRLNVNTQRRGEQTELLGKLAGQSREYLRWRQLDELIGSADGKKYRNFAQGLTFEQMVVQANRQLARMSDRYRLVRDLGQPLELNVTDRWQADEIRSAKNLSGGESFVVSLALALGLSGMAGGKVESLFLDEGFGTLDDAALDTALESLAELRREGRLIGVISHVAALKERIACRIEVLPKAGGRSLIRGPGVRGG
ncbi:hypothetical protein GCAAIG_07080 [Candidatus Electronema halotolerans]